MAATSARLLLWTPRALGILLCMFLGLFALDAFRDAASRGHAVADFLIHLTPALLLLVIDEFLASRGCTVRSIAGLPRGDREPLLRAAAAFATLNLAEIEARAHLLDDMR
jgi:hypothetical protein